MSDSDKTEEIVDYFGKCVIEEVYDPAMPLLLYLDKN